MKIFSLIRQTRWKWSRACAYAVWYGIELVLYAIWCSAVRERIQTKR